jgi:catechol 2,3-dioxygenase-like lactoylglutathione lyase family enzyme
MKAQLTHIAISAVNPKIMKTFYQGVFGLRPISERNPDGFLTDGYINFAFNYRKPGYQAGLDHFGFEVDDVDEVLRRMAELYPEVDVTTRPGHRGYVGRAGHDPEGHVFDLTYAEMGERRRNIVSGATADDRTTRHIHHLAMRVLDPERIAKFYTDVFDLQVVKEPGVDRVQHLTDGMLTFAIMPWRIKDFAEAGIVERPNLDHIGFEVESIDAYKHDVEMLVSEYPEAKPWADHRDEERLRNERAARANLLATCEYHEAHLWDPECVFFDVHERGAESTGAAR